MLKWFHNRSLTFKLSLSILICLFLGMAAISAFVSTHSQQALETQILEAANNSVKGTIAYIGETISSAEQAVQTVSNTLTRFSAKESVDMENMLQSTLLALNKKGNNFIGIWLFMNPDEKHPNGYLHYAFIQDGKMQMVSREAPSFYKEREWYLGALKKGALYWGEPFVDENEDGRPLVTTASVPFQFSDDQQWSGVVAVSFDLKEMQDRISTISFYETGRILLVSKSGLYMVHPDENIRLKMTIFDLAKVKKLPELYETGKRVLSGETGIVRMAHSSVFGDSVIFFFAPVPGPDWGVFLVFSQSQFFEPLQRMTNWILFASVVGLLVLLILIWFICKRSTAPLLQLSRAAREFGLGHFDAKLPNIHSSDEIGTMSEAFYKMRDSLVLHIEQEKQEAAESERRKSELEIARQIQKSALPVDFDLDKTCEIYASMNAAKEVGGDFYDFFMVDKTHLALLIADVSGKGVPASLFMMKAKALIKNKAQSGCDADELFTQVNKELCQNNDAQMFVTAFFAVLDTQTGTLTCVNAGHNPPLFKGACDKYRYLKMVHSLALGMMDDVKYTQQDIYLGVGDKLFFYTDGVTEAQNKDCHFYGEDRLKSVLDKTTGDIQSVLTQVREDVNKFAQDAEQADDITMLGLCYRGRADGFLNVMAQIENWQQVQTFLEEQMQKIKASQTQLNRLILATEEIFTNIAHYAYEGKKGRVQIDFKKARGFVQLQFRDCGIAYNPLLRETPDVSQNAEDRSIGGLGIFLVRQTMDKVMYAYQNNENVLTIQMKLEKKK